MRVNGTVQSNLGQHLQRDRRTARHLATHVAFSCSSGAVVVVVVGGYARASALSGVPTPSERVPGSAGSGNAGPWRRSLVGAALAEPLPP